MRAYSKPLDRSRERASNHIISAPAHAEVASYKISTIAPHSQNMARTNRWPTTAAEVVACSSIAGASASSSSGLSNIGLSTSSYISSASSSTGRSPSPSKDYVSDLDLALYSRLVPTTSTVPRQPHQPSRSTVSSSQHGGSVRGSASNGLTVPVPSSALAGVSAISHIGSALNLVEKSFSSANADRSHSAGSVSSVMSSARQHSQSRMENLSSPASLDLLSRRASARVTSTKSQANNICVPTYSDSASGSDACVPLSAASNSAFLYPELNVSNVCKIRELAEEGVGSGDNGFSDSLHEHKLSRNGNMTSLQDSVVKNCVGADSTCELRDILANGGQIEHFTSTSDITCRQLPRAKHTTGAAPKSEHPDFSSSSRVVTGSSRSGRDCPPEPVPLRRNQIQVLRSKSVSLTKSCHVTLSTSNFQSSESSSAGSGRMVRSGRSDPAISRRSASSTKSSLSPSSPPRPLNSRASALLEAITGEKHFMDGSNAVSSKPLSRESRSIPPSKGGHSATLFLNREVRTSLPLSQHASGDTTPQNAYLQPSFSSASSNSSVSSSSPSPSPLTAGTSTTGDSVITEASAMRSCLSVDHGAVSDDYSNVSNKGGRNQSQGVYSPKSRNVVSGKRESNSYDRESDDDKCDHVRNLSSARRLPHHQGSALSNVSSVASVPGSPYSATQQSHYSLSPIPGPRDDDASQIAVDCSLSSVVHGEIPVVSKPLHVVAVSEGCCPVSKSGMGDEVVTKIHRNDPRGRTTDKLGDELLTNVNGIGDNFVRNSYFGGGNSFDFGGESSYKRLQPSPWGLRDHINDVGQDAMDDNLLPPLPDSHQEGFESMLRAMGWQPLDDEDY